MRNVIKLLGLFVASVFFLSCDNEEDMPSQPQTIAEIASNDSRFSTLVSALDRTGLVSVLDGTGNYTVFAPTNEAFTALGVDLATLSNDELTEILLYHVLGAKVKSTDIAAGQTYVSTASNYGPEESALSLLIEKSSAVTLNADATVQQADIEASNGVIHVIDKVLLPLDIVGHAAANENFTELVAALQSADLVSTLQSEGPFSVFAPVNAAFEEIAEVTATLTTEELASVLTYHVVSAANVQSSELSDGQEVSTVNGASFRVNLGANVTITDATDAVANVVLVDVQATNGIIHVLNKVLLPQ